MCVFNGKKEQRTGKYGGWYSQEAGALTYFNRCESSLLCIFYSLSVIIDSECREDETLLDPITNLKISKQPY